MDRVDWNWVLLYLELGYSAKSLAAELGIRRDRLGLLAKRELTDEAYATYKRLAHQNRMPTPECGSHGGYERHLRLKEPVCAPCRKAHNQMQAAYRRRTKVRKLATYTVEPREFRGTEYHAILRTSAKGTRYIGAYETLEDAQEIRDMLSVKARREAPY